MITGAVGHAVRQGDFDLAGGAFGEGDVLQLAVFQHRGGLRTRLLRHRVRVRGPQAFNEVKRGGIGTIGKVQIKRKRCDHGGPNIACPCVKFFVYVVTGVALCAVKYPLRAQPLQCGVDDPRGCLKRRGPVAVTTAKDCVFYTLRSTGFSGFQPCGKLLGVVGR